MSYPVVIINCLQGCLRDLGLFVDLDSYYLPCVWGGRVGRNKRLWTWIGSRSEASEVERREDWWVNRRGDRRRGLVVV